MKQYLKRSAAWLLCLAMVLGLFAGVPGAVISKVSAEETEGTETETTEKLPYRTTYSFNDTADVEQMLSEGWTALYGGTSFAKKAFSIVEKDGHKVLQWDNTPVADPETGEFPTYTNSKGEVKIAGPVGDVSVGLATPYIEATAGKTYNIAIETMNTGDSSSMLYVYYYDADKNNVKVEKADGSLTNAQTTLTMSSPDQWSVQSVSGTAPEGTKYLRIMVYNGPSNLTTAWYDNLSVQEPIVTTNTNKYHNNFGRELQGLYSDGMNALDFTNVHTVTAVRAALGWSNLPNDAAIVTYNDQTALYIPTERNLYTPLMPANGMTKIKVAADIAQSADCSYYVYSFDTNFNVIKTSGTINSTSIKGIAGYDSTKEAWYPHVSGDLPIAEGAAYFAVMVYSFNGYLSNMEIHDASKLNTTPSVDFFCGFDDITHRDLILGGWTTNSSSSQYAAEIVYDEELQSNVLKHQQVKTNISTYYYTPYIQADGLTKVTVSGMIKVGDVGDFYVYFYNASKSELGVKTMNGTRDGAWHSMSKTFDVPENTAYIRVMLHNSSYPAPSYYENISVACAHAGATTEKTYVVTEPTCSVPGVAKTATCCAECGKELSSVESPIPTIGHTNGTPVKENINAAECGKPGSYEEVVYCTVCKAEVSRTSGSTDALEHSYKAEEFKASFDKNAYTKYTCSLCGDTYEVEKEGTQLVAAAKIGDERYVSFAAALAAAKDGDTITLLADVITASGSAINLRIFPANLTIDGNGHTVSGISIDSGKTADAALADVTLASGLTITNVTLTQNIRIVRCAISDLTVDNCNFIEGAVFVASPATGDRTINNLTVTNCEFSGTDSDTTANETSIKAYNLSGTTTITNNIITASEFNGIQFSVEGGGKNTGTFVITGNTISGTVAISVRLYGFENAEMTISDNTITPPEDTYAIYINASTNTVITGNNEITCPCKVDNNYYGGHSFTNYVYDKNATVYEDGTETAKCDRCDATDTRVVEDTKLTAVAKIGDDLFETLADAYEAAQTGDTITLLADIDLGAEMFAVRKQITIDLGGKNIISGYTGPWASIYVAPAGDLTITGEGTITAADVAIGNYGDVTINGGVITGANAALYNFYSDAATYGTATIAGGELNTVWNTGDLTVTAGAIDYVDNSHKLAVTGGTITELEITEADYAPVNGTTTTVTGGTVTNVIAVAKIGNAYYATVADAFADAEANDTITLLADATIEADATLAAGVTYEIPAGLTLTVAEGVTVTADAAATLNCYGTIVVAGKADISKLVYGQIGEATFGACGGKLVIKSTGTVVMLTAWEGIWTPVNNVGGMLQSSETGAKVTVGAQQWLLTEAGWAHQNHVYGEGVVTTDPTCEDEGVKTFTCTALDCGCTKTEAVDALGHDNEYVNNGDGTHDYVCDTCGTAEIEAEAHIYADAKDTDCEKCGAVRVVGPIKDDALNVMSHSIELKSDMRLNFYVSGAALKDATNYYIIFNKTEDYASEAGTLTVGKDGFKDAYGYYFAQYPVIRGCEMTVQIEATLYVEYADGTVRCSAITDSCSVADCLAVSMLDWEGYIKRNEYADYYSKMITLAVEMLNYGAEAQKRFNFKGEEEELATKVLTDELKAYALAEDPTPVKNLNWGANNSSMPVVFLSSNLDLQSRIYNQIFIDIGSQNVEELKAVVKDSAGNVLQTVTELRGFTSTLYAIPITEILPSEVHTIYTVQVFAGETAVSELAEYSVESCLYDLCYMESMADYRALGNAIMRYCVAADMAF